MQTKDKIAAAVKAAVEAAMNDGALKFSDALPDAALDVPPKKEFGDFATNFAMQTAKIFRTSPRKIAEEIKARIDSDLLERVEIAGAGFMNFYLKPDVIYRELKAIYDAGANYGHLPNKGNVTIQIEYVSANPTGLLHVGHGRGAAAGSAIINIMRAAGYNVESEYYINDAGNQMDKLALSVDARYRQLLGQTVEFPEDGYRGEDIIDTTRRIIKRHGDKYLNLPDGERIKTLGELAYADKMLELQTDLRKFGVQFDKWFSERTLHPDKINAAIEQLKERGGIYEADGALWLASSKYGDDKDRVVVRENGEPTYLAADIAYHKNKYERGFGELINLWGADHHGYVARVKAAMTMLDYDADKLKIIFLQMVSLFRSGEAVKMSKRAGTDAARYFFLMRSTDSQLDFDLDLAKSQSADNPVYYIQYAHARICSIFRQTKEAGLTIKGEPKFALMNSAAEIDLINKIFEYPDEIERAATEYAPQRIARYVYDLASTFSAFYRDCRILGVEEDLAIARLALLKVTRHTIQHALGLLGVSAPERM